jgi:excisionase family DNA binding protein
VNGTPVAGRGRPPAYRWLSPARAAELLGITLRELYALVDAGDLPAYRIAGEIKLLAHDVDRWRLGHPRPDGPDAPESPP